MQESNGQVYEKHSTTSIDVSPLATAAALDGSVFGSVTADDGIPAAWEDRAKQAWAYYLEEPIVKNAINSWRTFAVGEEIKIASEDDNLRAEATDLARHLNLSGWIKDMVLQMLVKGDAVGFKKAGPNDALEELVSVNPTSVKVRYVQGQLVEAKQHPENPGTADVLDLPVDQVLHLKWDAPGFSPRGNSMVLPAFQSIELLRDYRKAERAIAKRWATPFRLLKVGGSFGPKLVMPDQKMLETVRDMVNRMDMKSGLVVPFYVNVETHGTEGSVLNAEEKVREVKEDIMIALGLSKSLVSGDGPNFATASVSLQKMLIMIREIKHAALRMLHWVFDDWLQARGQKRGAVQFLFNDLDPSDAVDFKRLLLELYDRNLISRASLQTKMDLDPDFEKANQEAEQVRVSIADDRQVANILGMVAAGIMGPETAQELLGLDPGKNPTGISRAESDWGGLNAAGRHHDELCDDCGHFDADENRCRVHQSDRAFDEPACRFFERRVV